MSSADMSRTHFASQAIELSKLLALRFSDDQFGTAPPRRVDVTTPDGPSTDGGRKARQSIVLRPSHGPGDAIICGYIDPARRTAELKTFVVLEREHQARYRTPADISRGEYDRFINQARSFLDDQGIETHLSTVPHVPENPARTKTAHVVVAHTSNWDRITFLILGLALGYGAAFAIHVLRLF